MTAASHHEPIPFIGREAELTLLRECLEELVQRPRGVKAPSPHVFLIQGESGMGKTRLLSRMSEVAMHEAPFRGRFQEIRLGADISRGTAAPLSPAMLLERIYLAFKKDRRSPGRDFAHYQAVLQETRSTDKKDALLIAHLATDLALLAAKKPLIVLIDNYERLVETCDDSLRDLIAQSGPHILWIISGWNRAVWAGRRYRDSFGKQARNIRLNRLKREELSQCMHRYMPRYAGDINRIYEFTLGIPGAVEIVIKQWTEAQTSEEKVEALDHGIQFWLGDRDHQKYNVYLYALALLSIPKDAELLGEMFDTTDPALIMEELVQRYPFVNGKAMTFDGQFLYILQRYIGSRMRWKRPEIKDIHRRAIAHLEARRKEIERSGPTYGARVNREEWREVQLALLYHHFWLSEQRGWVEAAPVLLAAYHGNRPYLVKLKTLIGQFEWMFSATSLNRLTKLAPLTIGPLVPAERQFWADTLESLLAQAARGKRLTQELKKMIAGLRQVASDTSSETLDPKHPPKLPVAQEPAGDVARSQQPSAILPEVWRVLDPPAEASDRTPHESTAYAEGANGWYIVGASRRGRLHEHEGAFREDAFQINVTAGWCLIAVADGATGRALSRVGASLAVSTALSVLQDILEHHRPHETVIQDALREALKHSQEALRKEALQRRRPMDEFATTLLLLAYYPRKELLAVAQVGDGLLGAQLSNGEVLPFSELHLHPYSGQALFLTDHQFHSSAEAGIELLKLDRPIKLLFAMTAGMVRDWYPPRERLSEFVDSLSLLSTDLGMGEHLLDLIRYDASVSFEDRTLVILGRP